MGSLGARFPAWYQSTTFKLVALGILALLLLIPTGMIRSLVMERHSRRSEVQHEVTSIWGGEQTLYGPVIVVPYREMVTEEQRQDRQIIQVVRNVRRNGLFLPLEMTWRGSVEPEIRYRGIYEVVVYTATLHAEGSFIMPDLSRWRVAEDKVIWDEAVLVMGIPDLKGLQHRPVLHWQDAELPFEPGSGPAQVVLGGLHARLPDLASMEQGARLAFSYDLEMRGSDRLRFLPTGEETRVELSSPWPSPSFAGAFLPNDRQVGAEGFEATWQVPYFGRGVPQRWRDHELGCHDVMSAFSAAAFGVDLYIPADGYQRTERSLKYAILFIVLTFFTFFLLEAVSPARLHPIHYLLVGLGLCLFYLLLLAVSEHLGFGIAYLLASTATALLISGYSWSILRQGRRAVLLLCCLAGLYGYLYTLLTAEDFSLLMGAVGLFVILAFVMFVTRRMDWYTLGASRQEAAPPSEELAADGGLSE